MFINHPNISNKSLLLVCDLPLFWLGASGLGPKLKLWFIGNGVGWAGTGARDIGNPVGAEKKLKYLYLRQYKIKVFFLSVFLKEGGVDMHNFIERVNNFIVFHHHFKKGTNFVSRAHVLLFVMPQKWTGY